MAESYVGKEEFNILVKRVDKMEEQNEKNEKLLQEVDKKVDVILEKITNVTTTEELKLAPIKKSLDELEESKKWLWRLLISTILGLAVKYWIG